MYSHKARFEHHRQLPPGRFVTGTLKTVPISHTSYHGHKYAKKGAEAVVGKLKGDGWRIQSILTKKHKR